jgi:hypothetical protein
VDGDEAERLMAETFDKIMIDKDVTRGAGHESSLSSQATMLHFFLVS